MSVNGDGENRELTVPLLIKGLNRKKIIRFFHHGGLGVCISKSNPRLMRGGCMHRHGSVRTIKDDTRNPNIKYSQATGCYLLTTNVASEFTANHHYNVSVTIKSCNSKWRGDRLSIAINTTKDIKSTACDCSDVYGDWAEGKRLKKCKHVCALSFSLKNEDGAKNNRQFATGWKNFFNVC